MGTTDVRSRQFFTGYRSTFAFRLGPEETCEQVVEGFVRTWLSSVTGEAERVAKWDGLSELVLEPKVVVQEAHLPSDNTSSGGLLFRVYLPESLALADSGDGGGGGAPGRDQGRDSGSDERCHRTTIYAFPGLLHGREAVNILIQGATDDDSIARSIDEYEVPSLVGMLLRSRTAYDGETHLSAEPKLLHRRGIKQVLDSILDPERHAAVVVGSSPAPEAEDTFAEVVQSLARRTLGAATVFIISADAVDTFNRRAPEHLQVPAGDIRTFMAGVDPTNPASAGRHRYVGPETLAHSLNSELRVGGFLPTLFARGPRRQLLTRPLDSDLVKLRALVEKQSRTNRFATLVNQRMLRRQGGESAEVGLGDEGEASFDSMFMAEVEKTVQGTLPTESTDTLRSLLTSALEEAVKDSNDENAIAQVAADDPSSTESLEAEVFVGAPPVPEPHRQLERPVLNVEGTGIERLISFLRRWLYPKTPSANSVDEEIVQVDRNLSVIDEERLVALELVEEAHEEQSRLLDELTQTQRELHDARADAALLSEEADLNASKIAHYRRELLAAKKFEALQGEVPVDSRWHHPKDLHEIITLLTTGSSGEWLREYVVFSGDRGLADVVAQRDAHSHYAGSVWRFVHSLYDYARLKVAGEISENFEMYLKDDEIDGHKVSLRRYSAHESDTVRGREELRRVRTFPVPVSVDPNGSTFMEAHLRIGSGDGFSPRLYFLDNVEGDGRIYIGYIGRHPRTGKKA